MATISFTRNLKIEDPKVVKKLVEDLVLGGEPLIIPKESLKRLKEEKKLAKEKKSQLEEIFKRLR